ncbi:hypothetical protein D9758_000337 [Tetrapyrgos nigripes]|uniref:NADH dehydrogenase [ubiquinone] 1 alpha subcomplex subunit 11 n=1 Tax=Tetrapyrgos nigripes TaxID=182062 RepID=A0A8H5LZ23_9AGAR|nr:hypothetical protein D9758_000337 [Tetrapyrgos nigripes]
MPEHFDPKPVLKNTTTVGLQSGTSKSTSQHPFLTPETAAVGTVVSTLQNALGSHSRGAAGVFTRSGSTITFFTAMGAAFAFTESMVANQREKNDAINGAAGACAAGFLAGIRARSLPVSLAGCAFLGTVVGLFDQAGQFTGNRAGSSLSPEERSSFFKKPLELPESSE